MAKTIDGSLKQATIKGIITRIVNLPRQHMVMLTIDTRGTTISTYKSEFTLSEKITFKVDCSGLCKQKLLEALTFAAVGDEVTVIANRSENGKWLVSEMIDTPKLGREADDWLNDVDAEMARWNK